MARRKSPSVQTIESSTMRFALTVDGLTVDFGGFKVVDNFTTTIDDGELRVILGPNGAGKQP